MRMYSLYALASLLDLRANAILATDPDCFLQSLMIWCNTVGRVDSSIYLHPFIFLKSLLYSQIYPQLVFNTCKALFHHQLQVLFIHCPSPSPTSILPINLALLPLLWPFQICTFYTWGPDHLRQQQLLPNQFHSQTNVCKPPQSGPHTTQPSLNVIFY